LRAGSLTFKNPETKCHFWQTAVEIAAKNEL